MSKKGERTECPWCHKMRSNLWEHKKHCKRRPDGAENPKSKIRNPKSRRGRRHGTLDRDLPARRAEAAAGPVRIVAEGPQAAVALSLVEEAVRGGMGLGAACALVVRALSR